MAIQQSSTFNAETRGGRIKNAVIGEGENEQVIPWETFKSDPAVYGYDMKGRTIDQLEAEILRGITPPAADQTTQDQTTQGQTTQREGAVPGMLQSPTDPMAKFKSLVPESGMEQFRALVPGSEGVVPEIEKTPEEPYIPDPTVSGVGFFKRSALSISDFPKAELEDHFGVDNVAMTSQGLAVRRSEREDWRLVDESGFDFMGDVVADWAGDIPEIAGAYGGYALAGALAPLTGGTSIAATGLAVGFGQAVGRFMRHRIADLIGVRRREGWDAAKDIRTSGIIGTLADVGSAVVFRGLSRFTRGLNLKSRLPDWIKRRAKDQTPDVEPGPDGPTQEMIELIRQSLSPQTLERIGKYGLTPGQQTMSKAFLFMEGFTEHAIFGGRNLVRAKQSVIDDLLENGVRKVANRWGAETIGETPAQMGREFLRILNDEYKLYKAFPQEVRNFIGKHAESLKADVIDLTPDQVGKMLKSPLGQGQAFPKMTSAAGDILTPPSPRVGFKVNAPAHLKGAELEATNRMGMVISSKSTKDYAEKLAENLKNIGKGWKPQIAQMIDNIKSMEEFVSISNAISLRTQIGSNVAEMKAAGALPKGFEKVANDARAHISDAIELSLKKNAPELRKISEVSGRFPGHHREDYTLLDLYRLSNRMFRVAEDRYKPPFLATALANADPKTARALGIESAPEEFFDSIFTRNTGARIKSINRALPLDSPRPEVVAARQKLNQYAYNRMLSKSIVPAFDDAQVLSKAWNWGKKTFLRSDEPLPVKGIGASPGLTRRGRAVPMIGGAVDPDVSPLTSQALRTPGQTSGELMVKELTGNHQIGASGAKTQAFYREIWGDQAFSDLVRIAEAIKHVQRSPKTSGEFAGTLIQVAAFSNLMVNPVGGWQAAALAAVVPRVIARYSSQGAHNWIPWVSKWAKPPAEFPLETRLWNLAQIFNHKGGRALMIEGLENPQTLEKFAALLARLAAIDMMLDRADDEFLRSGRDPDYEKAGVSIEDGNMAASITPSGQ